MDEILDHLPEDARVLDLGSHSGSFPAGQYRFRTVRVDLERARTGAGRFVQADAAKLPFRSRLFDAVILNHSLEHFVELKPALQEIGRVVKRDGAVFVAVPDARTFADKLYRRIYRQAGGHVNFFGSAGELEESLSWYFGLPHVATRTLHCSFLFLNRRNTRDPALRRAMRFRGLPEPALAAFTAALRLLDRRLHTRAGVYGWALYFGQIREPVDPSPRINVCIRCGQGHAAEWLARLGRVQRTWKLFQHYLCPGCGARNLYMDENEPASRRVRKG